MSPRSVPIYPAIADYALLSDCHSCALVSSDGSIDWCTFHRFEARPVFARILDWANAGFFRIAPLDDDYEPTRRYLPGTNVLETTFRTPTGMLVLTDFFAYRVPKPGEDAHSAHPDHQLIRIARCTDGEVAVKVKLVPRFDYGLTTPRLETLADDLVVVYGGADALVLQSELPFGHAERSATEGNRTLRAGEEAFVVLTYQLPHELEPRRLSRDDVQAKLETTTSTWKAWAERCTYEGPYRDQVVRSALVLKALTNGPTGSIVAAATTSLPEEIGGERNWDYRFSWLRDSALTLNALFALGYDEEANAYMEWLKRTTAGRASELQIMYGVGGERLLPEVELDWLEGYRGSRPVRIGNGAAQQFQLDTFGELLDTAWLWRRQGGRIGDVFWDFLSRVGGVVLEKWQEPDQGIWEIRGQPQHFVYSKVMAWVALDRLVRIAEVDEREVDPRWIAAREEIRSLVEREGVDADSQSFVQYFGSESLDASNLMIPIVGFVSHDDPRARATADRIADELSADGFVYRYVADGVDGLSGEEATFAICSFWLVECLARAGETDRARTLFERLLGFCNDVGLLAEEIDPHSGELIGNFPQAFSHLGLIQAAIALDLPERSMSMMTSEATPAAASP
ncbi:MAG TPA: glycoside hydrolase family 15 protein [Gaiellaceae bacterium]|nr:glycoside hydrolase family 15 protein [Gaiellaceae bacterium]